MRAVTVLGQCDIVGMAACTLNLQQCAMTNATCACLALYKSCLATYSCLPTSPEFSLASIPAMVITEGCSMLGCDCDVAPPTEATQCNIFGAVQANQYLLQCLPHAHTQTTACSACIDYVGGMLEYFGCADSAIFAAPIGDLSTMMNCSWVGPSYPAPRPGEKCSIDAMGRVLQRAYVCIMSDTSRPTCDCLDAAAAELDVLACPSAPHDLAHILVGVMGANLGCACESLIGITTPIIPGLANCSVIGTITCMAQLATKPNITMCTYYGEVTQCLQQSHCSMPVMELLLYEVCFCAPPNVPIFAAS